VKATTVMLHLCSLIAMLSKSALAAKAGQIIQASRNVFLAEPDITLYTNNLLFKPGSQDSKDGKTIFEYVIATDYADTLIALEAIT